MLKRTRRSCSSPSLSRCSSRVRFARACDSGARPPVTSTHTPFVCPLALPPQTTSKATQPRRERVALFFWRLGKKSVLCHVLSHWKCRFGYLPAPTENAGESASETPDPPFLSTQFAICKITADSEQKNLFCFLRNSPYNFSLDWTSMAESRQRGPRR